MSAIEAKQESIDDLVDLLRDVRTALKIFVKIGNGFRWLIGLGVTIGGAYLAFRKWMQP